MNESICGVDCSECMPESTCKGCVATNGRPFDAECIVARCCGKRDFATCGECSDSSCGLRQDIVSEFKLCGVAEAEKIDALYALKGSFVNLEYSFESGVSVKLLDDNKIYLGTQIQRDENTCVGFVADENCILICEYGPEGANPRLLVYKKR